MRKRVALLVFLLLFLLALPATANPPDLERPPLALAPLCY